MNLSSQHNEAPTAPVAADPSEMQRKTPHLIAVRWWVRLQRTLEGGATNPQANPGALARLRRCAAPIDALAKADTIHLCRMLGCGPEDDRIESIACLAIVLAHVRDDSARDAPTLTLGACLGGEAPVLSDIRLRRLLAARDGEEVLRGFREAVSLLKDKAPIPDLARLMLNWLHPERGDKTRTRFLFDYHGASIAAASDRDASDAV